MPFFFFIFLFFLLHSVPDAPDVWMWMNKDYTGQVIWKVFFVFHLELNCYRFWLWLLLLQRAADLQHPHISHNQMTQVHCLSVFFCFSLYSSSVAFFLLSHFTLFLHFDMTLNMLWIYIIQMSEIVSKRGLKIVPVFLSPSFLPFHLISSSLWHKDRAMVWSQVMKLLSGALK